MVVETSQRLSSAADRNQLPNQVSVVRVEAATQNLILGQLLSRWRACRDCIPASQVEESENST